jgi:FKBP-type peptidyl-prolyl cis-trans isomerase
MNTSNPTLAGPSSTTPTVGSAPAVTPTTVASDPAVPTTFIGVPPPTVITAASLVVVSGGYNLAPLIRQLRPVIFDTNAAPPPDDVTVAITNAGTGSTVARPGGSVRFTFQMYAWQTGELYDSSPAGSPLTVTLGSGDVSPALDAALTGMTSGTELIVTYPVGVEGLPDFVPDDDAYYLLVVIEDVA